MITRKRKFQSKKEESVLDFCVINEKLRPYFKEMIIDEDRDFCLTNIAQIKKNGRLIESVHNSSFMDFDIQIGCKYQQREEMFNFRNKNCQDAFLEATENNRQLLDCFENDMSFEKQSRKWKKTFDSVIFKCFKKVRIVGKKNKEENKLQMFEKLKERKQMKKDLTCKEVTEETKELIEERIKRIEEEIEKEVSEEHMKEVMKTLRELGGEEDSISGDGKQKMWKLLKKVYPKISPAVPVGKKDKSGNIITNHESLKHLYLKTYINRLRSRPVKEGFEDMKTLKMKLFDMRLNLSRMNKSQPWTLKNLETALKCLKKDKARDPNGLINELFKKGVAGKNFKLSLL